MRAYTKLLKKIATTPKLLGFVAFTTGAGLVFGVGYIATIAGAFNEGFDAGYEVSKNHGQTLLDIVSKIHPE